MICLLYFNFIKLKVFLPKQYLFLTRRKLKYKIKLFIFKNIEK